MNIFFLIFQGTKKNCLNLIKKSFVRNTAVFSVKVYKTYEIYKNAYKHIYCCYTVIKYPTSNDICVLHIIFIKYIIFSYFYWRLLVLTRFNNNILSHSMCTPYEINVNHVLCQPQIKNII